MNRLSAILVAALVAAAPVSAAAQSFGQSDRERARPAARPQMSELEAQSIAIARNPNATLVGSRGYDGSAWVFRFERRGGGLFDVRIPA